MQTSRKLGMSLMNDSLLDLVRKGIVAPEEALAKATDKAGLLALFRNNAIDTQDSSTAAAA